MVDHSGPCAKGLVFLTIFMVCMISCEGQSSEPATTIEPEVTTYPEVPIDLQITSVTNESMKVTWTNTNAAWYNVSWSNGTVHGHNVTESPPYNIESLKSGNRYNVSVRSCRTRGDCTNGSVSNSSITKPNKPRNLHVEVNRANSLNITWEKGDSVLAISHTVNISSSGSYEDHTTDGNTYVTGTLDANTPYKVEVFSTVKESPSPESEKTEKKETWTYPSPVNLTFNAESDYLEFSWDGSSAEAHVLVIHDVDNETCTCVKFGNPKTSCDEQCDINGDCNASESETGHEYRLNGTEPCGNYKALLYAVNEAGCSNETEEDDTSPPAEPREKITGLQVTDITESSMNVTWQPITYPARCEKTYTLMYSYYDCDENKTTTENISSGDQRYEVVDDLSPYTNYTFKVMANTSEDAQPGNSESDPATRQTKEGTPGKPEDIEYDESNGFLTWNVPECKRNGEINSYRVNYTCFERDRPDNITENNGTITTDPQWKVDFEPYRTCSVSVEAKTTDWGDAGEAEISTPEDTPGKVDFSHTADNTSIQLDWEEPEDRNGIIISYTVEWKKSVISDWNFTVLSNTNRSFTINDLTPFTEYNVSMYANTSAGDGERVYESVTTLTGFAIAVTGLNVSVDHNDSLKLDIAWNEGAITGDTKYTVCVTEADDVIKCRFNCTVLQGKNSTTIRMRYHYWVHSVEVITIVEQTDGSLSMATSNAENATTGKAAPGSVTNLKARKQGDDCRHVSFEWEALDKHYHNGEFIKYTIIVSRDDENIEEVALENYETTQTEVMVDGGKSYTVSIHAVNNYEDCEEGQKEDVDFTTNTCAPILEDTGANLVSESTVEVDDKQRTFPFQYNSTLFTDDSFGPVTLLGFLIREVTDKNESKANYSVQEFIGKYYSKWSDYYREDHTSYRINKTDPEEISKRSVTKDVLGIKGDCDGYCNGYLKPGKEYRIQMFSCTDGGCLVTADAKIQAKTADPTNNTPAIAIGVVVPLVVIMVLVIGAVVFRRRGGGKRARPIAMGNSRGQANPAFELKEPQPSGALYNLKKIARMRKMKKSRSKPVPLNRFQEKVNELHRDSDLKFSEEYKLLKEISPKNTWHAAEYPENRPKNRFTNILPFDHSRVKLLPEEDEDSGDYINANYMPGYNSKREFIAAQGPLPATKDDFWRMIWEQNIHTIIMLTRCLERGRPKCDQYWPTDSGEPIYYGDLECELKSESTLHNYTIRVMEISVGDRKRTVKQMHFTTWPDHGCPESTDDLLNFVQHVRQHVPYKANNQGPVLVHCSAGVGRTGTWICVDRLLQHIKDHEDVDIFGTVLEMRQYRCNMVQTEDQYIYIHDCIADAIQKGMHESTACYTVRAGPEGEEDEANLYENVDMKANGSANHA